MAAAADIIVIERVAGGAIDPGRLRRGAALAGKIEAGAARSRSKPLAQELRRRVVGAGPAAALASSGIAPLLEPMLDIHYRDAPAPDLAGVQAILCTSANGVRALARLSPERGCALLAVGESTAGRARAEGFLQIESAGGNVADLARLVRRRLWPDQGRLLHVAGTEIAGDLAGD